ncbi:hypothetical protein AcW1_007377 [Taiwanofungus camphoratus]|nr:hypothetical protein AcV7_006087 [Antrodia cinnamomea]KAI0953056.1 hypothetical protein AcW1_007377 [Antrodia cinnamomea]
MSSALNVAPALQAALYFDNLSLPRTVADVTSSLRHVVYGSPTLVVCVIINALMVYYVLSFFTARIPYPQVGYPHYLGSVYGSFRVLIDSKRMLREGYSKFKAGTIGVFKMPLWTNWAIILSDEKLIEEMYHLPDDVLSLRHAAHDELQLPYTMGQQIHDDPYHLPILRSKFTRHIEVLVRECLDELTLSLDDLLGRHCNDSWKEFNAGETFGPIVARTFNRILVGAPACRNSAYTKLCRDFAGSTWGVGFVINLFPSFLQPFVGNLITTRPRAVRKAMKHLGPVIEERYRAMADLDANWSEKPMDLLMWLMEGAEGIEKEPEKLIMRIIVINLATVHTTSASFVHALYSLLSYPEYVEPLRQEAEEALRTHGWTRAAVNQLVKADSFLKESSRTNALGSMSFPRKALQPITLMDGTYIPKGAYVSSNFSIHLDDDIYPDAHKFDGYRFLPETTPGGKSNNSSGFVRTNSHYLIFGHGKHPCPGRFLAAYMMKAMLAHILINYELKSSRKDRLPDICINYTCNPHINSTLMIRRRNTSA